VASSASAEQEITFGAFRLLQAQRLLIEGEDRPVPVRSRALALLFALVERAGELLSKEELFAKVWPDTFVEEGSLRGHIAGLRRGLNDGRQGNRYVVTLPGRGYSFVARTAVGRPAEPPVAPAASHNLPPTLPGMVGRDDIVRILAGQMGQRFVSVVGPGGIEKTTVAVAAAQELHPRQKQPPLPPKRPDLRRAARAPCDDLHPLTRAPTGGPGISRAYPSIPNCGDATEPGGSEALQT
jgi:DNA-binding winged helix-turn-helix (wHTH) protein